jgi:hypothetical protein
LTVRILAAQILANGAYTLRVTNPPFLIDTLSLGGGADTQALTVQADRIVSVDVAGTDTLLNAGDRSNFITLRFRDRSGNLVNHPAGVPSVSFAAAPDTSLPLSFRPAPAQGSFPVLQTGVGTYRLDTLRFFQAGAFRLLLDTSATGGLTRTGADFFRVMPLADSIATFEGLPGASSSIPAGDTLPSFTTKLVDKFGNFTDFSTAKWSFVRTTGLPAGGHSFASSATMRVQRLGTGFYRIEATTATVAGLYTFTLTGVPTTVGERTAQVVPLVASEVNISNVVEILSAGAKQSQAQLILTDRFGNRSDHLLPEQRQLWFSNSTDATILPNEAFTQAQAITQRLITSGMYIGQPVVGVYDVPATVALPFAGKYSFAVAGVTTTTGTTAFEVTSGNDNRVTFSGVPATIDAGSVLPSFNLRFEDAFGNLTDNGIGRLTYRKNTTPVSTATLALTRVSEGIYTVQSTVCTLSGTYNLAMSSVSATNTFGTKTFVIASGAAVRATFSNVSLSLNAGAQQAAFDVRFLDVFGNSTDTGVPTGVAYSNSTNATNGVSTGTITFASRIGIGLYDAQRVVLTTAGNYTLAANGLVNGGNRFFTVKPLAVQLVEFMGVRDTLFATQPLPTFTVQFFDKYLNRIAVSSPITFTRSGSPPITGIIPSQATSILGRIETQPFIFSMSGLYTLSVQGLANNILVGSRSVIVRNDTLYRMRIDSLVAQTLSLSEIATHNWTFRIRGQNFVPSAQVFYRYSSVPFATTFINANELQAVVPPSLRELGSYMLEVRSSVTRDTSNILPLYILDPELQTHDLLDVVRSEVPILTTEEQTLLNQILSRSDVLDARAVYLKRPPEILLSQKLRFSLLQGATATLAMGFPRQVGDGDFTMPGYVENDAQSSSSDITVTDNTFVGTNITVDSDSYTIQPLGNNGVHVIMKKNTTVTNGGECGTKGGSAVVNSETPIIGCDGRTIRVLFLATREVINQ